MVRVLNSDVFAGAVMAVAAERARADALHDEPRRFDVNTREGARQLLERIVGLTTDAGPGRWAPLRGALPAWTLLDEF